MLAAFGALSALGLRCPLQMLPVLLWELLWKSIWLIVVVVPLRSAGRMDQTTWTMASAIFWVAIVPIAIPWPYVFENYVKKPGNRWH